MSVNMQGGGACIIRYIIYLLKRSSLIYSPAWKYFPSINGNEYIHSILCMMHVLRNLACLERPIFSVSMKASPDRYHCSIHAVYLHLFPEQHLTCAGIERKTWVTLAIFQLHVICSAGMEISTRPFAHGELKMAWVS